MTHEIVARDVMQTKVVAIQPDHSLKQALEILKKSNVSGAPVVNDKEELVGVVTFKDIVECILDEEEDPSPRVGFLGENPDWWSLILKDRTDELDTIPVEEVMTTQVYTEQPDEPISSLATTMRERKVHRIIITQHSKVVGIVTTFDLLGILERH